MGSPHPSFLPLGKLTAGWCQSFLRVGGGWRGDDCGFAAYFCEALLIPRRCRKLNPDDVLAVLGCGRKSASHKKGENEALFPKKGI